MMARCPIILIGMAGGMAWSIGAIMIGREFLRARVFGDHALQVAGLSAGLVLLLMIIWMGMRRFFDDSLIDGGAPVPGSKAEIDRRVLTDTVEQLVLAAFLWPFIGQVMSDAFVLALAGSFVAGRLLYWVGYHIAPPWRALGFAITLYPTVLATIFGLVIGYSQGFFAVD